MDIEARVIALASVFFDRTAIAGLVGTWPFGLVKGEFRDGERWLCGSRCGWQ